MDKHGRLVRTWPLALQWEFKRLTAADTSAASGYPRWRWPAVALLPVLAVGVVLVAIVVSSSSARVAALLMAIGAILMAGAVLLAVPPRRVRELLQARRTVEVEPGSDDDAVRRFLRSSGGAEGVLVQRAVAAAVVIRENTTTEVSAEIESSKAGVELSAEVDHVLRRAAAAYVARADLGADAATAQGLSAVLGSLGGRIRALEEYAVEVRDLREMLDRMSRLESRTEALGDLADLVAASAADDAHGDQLRSRAAALVEQQALISAQTDMLRTTAGLLR